MMKTERLFMGIWNIVTGKDKVEEPLTKYKCTLLDEARKHYDEAKQSYEETKAATQQFCLHYNVAECPSTVYFRYMYPERLCLKCGLCITKDYCGRYNKGPLELNDKDTRNIIPVSREELRELKERF